MSETNLNIVLRQEYNCALKIYFNGILHLSIKLDELIGIQSWQENDNHYFIEYTLKTRDILTAYDTREKWVAVLKLLDDYQVF